MTCAELEVLICDYVDGSLSGERKAAVERHIAECAACAELARDSAAAVAFLESVPPVEPPDELVTRLLFQTPAVRQRRRRSLRDMAVGWVRPVLQPRFAMGMAMTILSFSLLGKFVGVPDRPLRPADLHPARVWEEVEDRFHRSWDRLVKYYENLRVVIEIQNRLGEWTEDSDQAGGSGALRPETQNPLAPLPTDLEPEARERTEGR